MEDMKTKVCKFLRWTKDTHKPKDQQDFAIEAGFGYGTAPGQGDGDGTGVGEGYPEFYGIVSINGHSIYDIDGIPTIIYSIKGDYAKGAILRVDMTLQDCWIARHGTSYSHEIKLRDAVQSALQKDLRNYPLSRRIQEFKSEYPTLNSKIKGSDFYVWHNALTGSCKLGRDNFKETYGLDPEKYYEVNYLLELCESSYRSDVIRRLIRSYGGEA